MTKRGSASTAKAKRAPSKHGPPAIPAAMKPVVEAFASSKQVAAEKGWGADSVGLKVKGKIFAMLVRGDLVVKLPAAKVDELVRAGAKRFDPRGDGREMKEWAVMPLNARDRVRLAREALEFVSGKKGS